MYYACMKFEEIPEIGFAHYYYTDNYLKRKYSKKHKSFEIVYIDEGEIEIELYGKKMLAKEGSIVIILRQLPLVLSSSPDKPQSHTTVQAEVNFDLEIFEETEKAVDACALILPFITEPCVETEEIRKDLYSIVSDIGESREKNSFVCSLRLIGVMQKIDRVAKTQKKARKNASLDISYKVKKYVVENIEKSISLIEIAKYLGKTPNYINYAFKKATGITIKQYINKEKINKIAHMIKNQNVTFEKACQSVGVRDVSYGYRMFKKHTGMTTKEFMAGDKMVR